MQRTLKHTKQKYKTKKQKKNCWDDTKRKHRNEGWERGEFKLKQKLEIIKEIIIIITIIIPPTKSQKTNSTNKKKERELNDKLNAAKKEE